MRRNPSSFTIARPSSALPLRLLVLCSALMLTGCGVSRSPPPREVLRIPPPPPQATAPCTSQSLPKAADGSMTAAMVEQALRAGQADLVACDARRALLVDSWPVISAGIAE